MEENKELNLLEFFIFVWRKIKKVVQLLLGRLIYYLSVSLKYFWIVIPVIIIFACIAYFFTTPNRRIYKVDGIIEFFSENRIAIEHEFKALNSLNKNNPDLFMKKLNLNIDQLKHFKEIKTFYVIDYLNDSIPDLMLEKVDKGFLTDTLNTIVPYMLGVRIILKGNIDYTPYQKGLVHYFNSQKNLYKTDSISKKMVKERIRFCDTELDRLSRLSEYDYLGGRRFSIKTHFREGITIEPSRKKLYYENMRDLIREKIFLTNYLTNKEEVINFILPYMNVHSASRDLILFLACLIGFIVGVVVASLWDKRKSAL